MKTPNWCNAMTIADILKAMSEIAYQLERGDISRTLAAADIRKLVATARTKKVTP